MQDSLFYKNCKVNTKKGYFETPRNKENYGVKHRTGYMYINLIPKGSTKYKFVQMHRAIWEEGHKRRAKKGLQIAHRNNNKTDNRLSNLDEQTPSENTRNSLEDRRKARQNPVPVIGSNLKTKEKREFISFFDAEKELGINTGGVTAFFDKTNVVNKCRSKHSNQYWTFKKKN